MRLIDADALIKEANSDGAYGYVDVKQIADAPTVDAVLLYMEDDFKKAIKKMPKDIVVDAVPVVRCKDCKHYKPQKKSAHWENSVNYCNRIVTIKTQPYDFCSYGERKDGDDND